MSVMLEGEERLTLLVKIADYQTALAFSRREYQECFSNETLTPEEKLALENQYFIERLLLNYLIGSLRSELADLRNAGES